MRMTKATDAADADPAALLRLMTWLSPAFPVGGFAYSHGLESAIAERRIGDAGTLSAWLETLLLRGSGWNDLVLFAEAFRAAGAGDAARMAAVRELAVALGGSRERRAETQALGTAFEAAALPWRDPSDARPDLADAPYPVAVARLAADAGIKLSDALAAYAHGFCANLVSVATRLVPLGQSQMVTVLHRLEPTQIEAARRAEGSTLDDLGSSSILSDIAAMRHESMATRLFRS
jgi:urease accessory protein